MNEDRSANPVEEEEVEDLMTRFGTRWAEESCPDEEAFVAEFSRRLQKETSLPAQLLRFPQRYWKQTISLAAAACLVGVLTISWLGTQPVGNLLFTHGQTRVQGAGEGDPALGRGSVVETMADARAMLSVDSDRINLYLHSETRLAVASADSVRLEKGEIWVRVEPNSGFFGIDTPHGFVHVHGTTFGVRVSGDETSVEIVSGEVSVGSSAGETRVVPGNGAVLKGLAGVPELHPTEGDRTPEWAKQLYTEASTAKSRRYFPSAAP